MAEFIIDEKTVENARDYSTLAAKKAFCDLVAERCWSKYQSTYTDNGRESVMPPIYAVDESKRRRYLMAAFVQLYFGAEIVPESNDDQWLMSEEQYDAIASTHPINRLQALKGNAKIRDKVFNIIDDYHDLEKMLRSELQARAAVTNDPVMRQNAVAEMQATQLKEAISALQSVRAEKREGEGNGADG